MFKPNYFKMPKVRHILLFIIISVFVLPVDATASIRRICNVQYATEYGWSKEYTMEVEFATGYELNERTQSFRFNGFKNYCLLWFKDGGVAIEVIKDYVVVGQEFDRDAFKSLFYFNFSIQCEQINSERNNPTLWRITAKGYGGFIDPRENY